MPPGLQEENKGMKSEERKKKTKVSVKSNLFQPPTAEARNAAKGFRARMPVWTQSDLQTQLCHWCCL